MSALLTYDPNALSEQPVPLPSAPLSVLSETEVLQPPLSRRGTGPGIILILPPSDGLNLKTTGARPLDPEPVQKWAEEGFAVVGVTPVSPDWLVEESLRRSVDALVALNELDNHHKFGVVVYDPKLTPSVISAISMDGRLACLIVYGSTVATDSSVPTLLHLNSKPEATPSKYTVSHIYPISSPHFVLPQVAEYDPGSAALAHSRSLVFLRKWLGGPLFDLEAIWDEHAYFEFEDRSVAKTMGTMVAEPYVNHVPTVRGSVSLESPLDTEAILSKMTGGVGRENLTAFYRDHFIFSNPADTVMQVVSRTVGPDRIVDEFIFKFTHDRTVDWLLPGVPPSGRKMAIPMVAIVNVRGDRLYNEHIWWDQGTALRQAGILPEYLPYPTPPGGSLRLPVAGAECAAMLADEMSGKSNGMFGSKWGLLPPKGGI